MKKVLGFSAALLFGVSISLSVSAERTAAQGPAGAGAAAATQSSVPLNPIKWVKKDPKNSSDAATTRSDMEKKLTPNLQTQGVLAGNTTATDACAPFAALDGCLAALHASHNLGVDFNCLRAGVTAAHAANVDLSGCKVAEGEKAESLSKAIHQLKPDANAKQATKDAEQQAKDDLKGVGG
jgi:hypothetical protein